MLKSLKYLLLATVLVLAGCGSGSGCGGDGGTSPFSNCTADTPTVDQPSTDRPAAAAIEVLASANTVGTAGQEVTVTAFVKAAGNVGISGAPVSFSTDSGVLTNVKAVTDANGVATASFSAGANKVNRTAIVTVRSGNASGAVSLTTTGSRTIVTGPSATQLGQSTELVVVAEDSARQPVSQATISISSALGNTVTPARGVTDEAGRMTFSYTATRSGEDEISIVGLGNTVVRRMSVSGADFVFTVPDPTVAIQPIPVNQSQILSVRYRLNGVGVSGRVVNFAATGGQLSASSAVTDGSGVATVSIQSTSAAPVTVQATLSATTPPNSVTASIPLQFVATVPARLVLQVTPSALAPNVGSSQANKARVIARVTDANDNPVQGEVVNFSRQTDPSGGNFITPSSVTDSNGVASVEYASGSQSTAANAVKLVARAASAPTTVWDDETLTVSQAALFIALGTGNVISNLDPQTYKKDWTVYVTDANGVAVPSVTLTVKAIPVDYIKGALNWDGKRWNRLPAASPLASYLCANEDDDFDGVLDATEDTNLNGILEPGNVVAVSPSVVTTDGTGRGTISLVYAESYAPWIVLKLEVTATVAGTASSQLAQFVVEGASEDFTNEQVPPAGVTSPFGVGAGIGCRPF